jgi:ribulose-phosphate 3-epimerase
MRPVASNVRSLLARCDELAALRAEIDARGLELPIGIDGGVNLDTIGPAFAAGGDVMVVGSALYRDPGDLAPVVDALRAAATAASPQPERS